MEAPTPYRNLLPPEEALLLICARREIPGELLEAGAALITRIDWERLLQLSLNHGVGPLVYASLKRHFAAAAPDACMAQLRQRTLANAQSNLSMLGELAKTARLLESNGVRFAVFKGLVVNETVYRDLAIRKCGDIDLLVDRKDFARAKALFVAEGFVPTLPDSAEIHCLQSGLWHEDRRLMIDLHWGIPPREVGVRAGRILDQLARISIGGVDLPAFSREDLFIALCVNATKEYWNQQLYPYCDIHEFLQGQADLDWKAVLARARTLKCERMMLAALGVVEAAFDHPLPHVRSRAVAATDTTAQELLHQLFDLEILSPTISGENRHLFFHRTQREYYLNLVDSPLRRFLYRHLYWRIWPLADQLGGSTQLALPRPLYFLHVIARTLQIAGLIMRKICRKLDRGLKRP
jgi:hypothetical protein